MTRLPHRTLLAVTVSVTVAVALAGCSGDESDPVPGPEESSATSSPTVAPTVPAITGEQAGRIKARMPRERVLEILGDPLLTQEPYSQFAGGCLYYPMEGAGPADVHQFCLNDQGVNLVLTAFASPTQPAAPEGASQARTALLARADIVCQSQYGFLSTITKDVGNALADFSDDPRKPNTDTVVREIGRFVNNLQDTHEILAAFNAPEDGLGALTTYLDALTGQIDALTQARQALADLDLEAYDEFGTDFNNFATTATAAAAEYGFATCTASSFS